MNLYLHENLNVILYAELISVEGTTIVIFILLVANFGFFKNLYF